MAKYTLDRNIKLSLNRAIKYKRKNFRWSKFLGYSLDDIKNQIENLFEKDMNWDNYGEAWGITFFIPRRLYNFTSFKSEEFRKCWALKNLRPQYLSECYRQKKIINMEEIDKYNLYDLLPVGKLKI